MTEPSPAIVTTTEADANGGGIDTESNSNDIEKADESEPCELPLAPTTTIPELEPPLDHNWERGDHVIRWEMLPIAYPIQIHAIVMEANEEFVKLVDFGLTAIPNQEKDDTERKEKYDLLHRYLVKPLQSKKKERLNIRMLTTQKELKPFSKVNYNGGFFGIGGNNSKDKDGGDEASKKKTWSNMFGKMKRSSSSSPTGGCTTPDSAASATATTFDDDDATVFTATTAATEDSATKEDETATNADGAGETSPNAPTSHIEEQDQPEEEIDGKATGENTVSKSGSDAIQESENGGDGSSEQLQEQKEGKPSPRSSKFMNSAMAKVMGNKSKSLSSPRVIEKKMSFGDGDNSAKETKANLSKLSKDDPTGLVLARVYFLLEHGETVLPPYNVFHSNSETIAVWCKTGHFRTIQADVFLHSTAIGNGKSATCVALGVAATSGLAAAGVAGLGVAAVLAPWWYLKRAKDKCGDATTSLNDAFWARADPAVFVECIGKWGRGGFSVDDDREKHNTLEEGSGPEEGGQEAKTEKKEDGAAGATAATTTAAPSPAEDNDVAEAATAPAQSS